VFIIRQKQQFPVNFKDAGRSFAIFTNGVSSGVNVPQLATRSDGVKVWIYWIFSISFCIYFLCSIT
jgi:hypothetical protein